MNKILIIEDDHRVLNFLSRGLKAEGYIVSSAENGIDGLQLAIDEKPDLVILDRMLPLMDGIDVLQNLRFKNIECFILLLSALGQVEDRVTGLKMGADDYLSKPFSFEELLLRVQALLRRNKNKSPVSNSLSVGDLYLDLTTLQVKRENKNIVLTAKELTLLELLMTSPKKVFSREKILSCVWQTTEDPMTNVVDVYIKRLRKKIDDGFDVSYLKTYRGIGYSLNPDEDSPE